MYLISYHKVDFKKLLNFTSRFSQVFYSLFWFPFYTYYLISTYYKLHYYYYYLKRRFLFWVSHKELKRDSLLCLRLSQREKEAGNHFETCWSDFSWFLLEGKCIYEKLGAITLHADYHPQLHSSRHIITLLLPSSNALYCFIWCSLKNISRRYVYPKKSRDLGNQSQSYKPHSFMIYLMAESLLYKSSWNRLIFHILQGLSVQ